ncbi:MAG: molybdopterin dinucleotide binding domain-containing protein, partial [Pseudoxanthomonas sp.]
AAATGAALCRIPQGANALGLARAGVLPSARDVAGMLAQPRAAYLIYGIEPGLDFADGAAALKALKAARVVAFSHYACQSTRAVADVILPIGALPEVQATLTNLDGVEQRTMAGAKLPGEAREGWRVLRALGGALELPGFEFADLAGARELAKGRDSGLGTRDSGVASSPAPALDAEGLEVVAEVGIYRSDATVRRAQALQAHPLNIGPSIALHPVQAQALGLAAGQVAKLQAAAGTATVPVRVDDRVPEGVVWVEAGHGATAPIGAGRVRVVAA